MAPCADITCCICEEVYNVLEKKPLVLPCGHTFCRSCLQQLKSRNDEICPICRRNWQGQPLDCLTANLQLVINRSDETTTMPKDKFAEDQNICELHKGDQLLWCEMCKMLICNFCLLTMHKSCHFIHIHEKTAELKRNLKETVTSTQSQLIKTYTLKMTANKSKLSDIRDEQKKMKHFEKALLSFDKKLSAKQEEEMSILKSFENISVHATVKELTIKISKALSLLDDPLTEPNISSFVIPDCEEPADDIGSEVQLDYKVI